MRNFYLKAALAMLLLLPALLGTERVKATNTSYDNHSLAAPVVGDDVFSTSEGVPISGNLLTNDSNPEGNGMNMVITPFPPPSNGSVFINISGDFSYTPNPGFTGVDQFGYRVCDDLDNCSMGTVTIYVQPDGCTPTVQTYNETSCDSCTLVCLDIALLDLQNNYELTQNGGPYYGELTGCNSNSINAYAYFGLLGQGNLGPYEILSWDIDGTVYTGSFNNPQELVVLMNQLDPAGGWFLNSPQLLVMGGSNTSNYGTMTVENSSVGSTTNLIYNTQTIDYGTIVCLESGEHNLVFNPLDGSCPEEMATVTIDCNITPPNAEDDAYFTDEGVAMNANVTNNDSDPLGGTLLVNPILISNPSNGMVTMNGSGSFIYTPEPGFAGMDSFIYEVCNAEGCDQATVTITVEGVMNNPPVAVDDAYTVNEGEVFTSNVQINDSDPDGDILTATILTIPNNGVIMLNVNGSFTYAPTDGFTGTDLFSYEICDPTGACDQATVVFTVVEVNAPPVAVDDAYTMIVGETLNDNVITNDSDPENDNLTVSTSPVSGPQMGILTLNPDGTFTYLSSPVFVGTDQFTYELCDDAGNCVTADVVITIQDDTPNAPPTAVDDNYTTVEDVPVMANSIDNDSDENMTTLTASLLSQPANGAVTFNADGTFTYMPFAGYIGDDQFTYEICDDQGQCDQATISITIEADCGITPEVFTSESCDSCVFVCLDLPFDDVDDYTITVNDEPYFGEMLACDFDTVIAYTYFTLLGQGNEGPYDLLSWEIDGNSYTGSFNDPAELAALMNSIDPQGNWQQLPGTFIIFGGVETSTYSVMMVQNLAAEFSFSEIGFNEGEIANGTAICVPEGQQTIEVTFMDEDCPQSVVEATIDCISNDPPVAVDDVYSTTMNMPITEVVTENDSDPNGDAIQVSTVLVSGPTNGAVNIVNTGDFTYTPNSGFSGTDMFTYEVCDGSGLCDTAMVTIVVTDDSQNNPPLAVDDNYTTEVDVPVNDNAMDNDFDPDGDVIQSNPSLIAEPTNGTASLNLDGTFVYTPDTGYVGTDEFTYEICDPEGLCDTAVVTIVIVNPAQNNPPLAVDDTYTTEVDVPVNDNVINNDSDPDGDEIEADTTLVTLPTNGTVELDSTGSFVYTPNPGYDGTDEFSYAICDPEGLCDTALVTITIVPAPCVPADLMDVTVVNANCGASDGQIDLVLGDDDALYTFIWADSDGILEEIGSTLSELSQGVYAVTITNVDDASCTVIESEIIVSEGNIAVTDVNTEVATCSAADGEATLLPDTYTYTWPDGTVANTRNDLAVGVYSVTVTDLSQPDCEVVVDVDIINDTPLVVDASITQAYCGFANGNASINATGGSGNYTYTWNDGSTNMDRDDLIAGVYEITVTDEDNGCEVFTSITITGNENCNDTIMIIAPQALAFDTCLTDLIDLPGDITSGVVCHDDAITVLALVNQDDACVNLDPNDDFVGMDTLCVYHCNEFGYCDTTTIIIEIEASCTNNFLGMDNEVLEADDCAGTADFCFPIPFGEFQNYEIFDNGEMVTTGIAGCNFDTIISYNYFTLVGNGELGPYILDSWTVDGNTFSGEFQTISDLVDSMNIWNPGGQWELDAPAELIIGLSGGTDYSDMLITHPLTNSNFDIGFNIGETSNGTFIELGVGLHEIIVTDLLNDCNDTVMVEVFCLVNEVLYDTIDIQQTNSICFDIPTNLPGLVDTAGVVNICPEQSGNNILFDDPLVTDNQICITYTGLSIGTDTACITICDDLGACETTTIVVTIEPEQLNNIIDTIYVDDFEIVCTDEFDYQEIFATMENDCSELGGESVVFDIDTTSGCVTYTGLEVGTDTACIVFCDDLGVCDTAYMYIHVLDTSEVINPILPIAMADSDSTFQGVPVSIDVVANDTLNGTMQTLFILENPGSGTAIVMGDTLITYTPSAGFCGQDSFIYMICNETDCDTAMVNIYVECTEFTVYNAISPNDDGVNDVLEIAGIEQYDRVSVTVFNRWGSVVYELRDDRYSNIPDDEGKGPWDGTWDGRELPDGTYFYCIELPEELGVRTGYIQLQR